MFKVDIKYKKDKQGHYIIITEKKQNRYCNKKHYIDYEEIYRLFGHNQKDSQKKKKQIQEEKDNSINVLTIRNDLPKNHRVGYCHYIFHPGYVSKDLVKIKKCGEKNCRHFEEIKNIRNIRRV